MEKLSTNKFIEHAKKVHGDKYDYSKVEYINTKAKVCIICPIHGEFWQRPILHLNGCGCSKCNKGRNRLTLKQFIEKSKEVHGDKYDYSKVEYVNDSTKVCIICQKHGEFWIRPHDFFRGHGCSKCFNEKRGSTLRRNKEQFIEKSKEVHGDKYDYSKIEYVNDSTKVCIICPKHGEFWQRPNDHLDGHGCIKCMGDNISKNKTKPYEDFLAIVAKIHNGKYSYDESTYVNRQTKMKIICPKHGEFWQTPHNHLIGQGCPYCKDSILEKELESILVENKINYINKCTSAKLEWLGRQHLDFYLPDYNVAIECQGIQHFEPREIFGGEKSFKETIERDCRKKQLCGENNVKLLYYSSEYLRRKFDKSILTKNNLIKHINNGKV